MPPVDDREIARRQHRAMGTLAVMQCWLRGWDGIVLFKSHFLRVQGLERHVRIERVPWIVEDFGEFFAHRKTLNEADEFGKLKAFASLWLSRYKLPDEFWSGMMPDTERLKQIPVPNLRMGVRRLLSQR